MPRIGDVPKLVSGAAQDFWREIQTSKQQPPFPTITLIYESRPRTQIRSDAVTPDASIARSHETAKRLGQTAAVCIEVWDGSVVEDGESSSAILINVWVEGRGPLFFSRRYRRDPFELLER